MRQDFKWIAIIAGAYLLTVGLVEWYVNTDEASASDIMKSIAKLPTVSSIGGPVIEDVILGAGLVAYGVFIA